MLKDNISKLKHIPIYPLLLAVYPILALRNFNIQFVSFSLILRSLVLTIVIALLGYGALRLVLKDWYKAGLISALGIILFFSYGHIYLFFEVRWVELFRHRYLLSLFGFIFVFGYWWVIKKVNDISKPTRFLNIVSLILVLLSLWQSSAYSFANYRAGVEAERNNEIGPQVGASEQPSILPDIYFIILDGYTRSDVLVKDYAYDNSEFIESLTRMGFYVAECSQSNYSTTRNSLTSAMNLNYLQDLFEDITLLPPWKSSVVLQTLDIYDYTTIRFENSVAGHFDLEEDILLSRNLLILENVSLIGGLNEFEMTLVESTLLRVLEATLEYNQYFHGAEKYFSGFYEHYLQTQFILGELENIPSIPGPKFVFAHIMVPHSPYVFTPSGEFEITGENNAYIGYRDNVEFLDNHIPSVLKTIIESSRTPPIIILQGDHGPTGASSNEARMKILNAYYISEDAQKSLYPSITPVNSFRVIFNNYFGSEYELLADVSYYSPENVIRDENIIQNDCNPAN